MILKYFTIRFFALICALLLFSLYHPYPSFSQSITGKVISVADGDTITILTGNREKIKIRLSAVDTPEGGQAYGKKAKTFTSSMVLNRIVRIEPETTDRYGRTVAMVLVNGINLNEQIVAKGHGWVFRKYCTGAFCNDWMKLEEKARSARLGLWADPNAIPPWEWRQQQRNNNDTTSSIPGGTGIYHGNTKTHVFHGSECRDYNCKSCTDVFENIKDAVKAGYHGHRECVRQ